MEHRHHPHRSASGSRRRVLAAAIAASFVLAGAACGGDDDTSPTTPAGDEAPGEFDETTIIGETLSDAEAIAEADGWQLRVIRIDGEDQAATADFVTNRVNVATVDDIVTEVISIG